MDTKKKSSGKKESAKKSVTIFNERPSADRASGFKLRPATRRSLRQRSSRELPSNLVPLYEKIAAKGKDGLKLSSLLPEDKGQASYQRFLIRCLGKMQLVKAIGEAPAKKEEKQ